MIVCGGMRRHTRSGPSSAGARLPEGGVAISHRGRGLEEALRSGELRIEGDESAVERFLTLFPLPEPAEGSAAGA